MKINKWTTLKEHTTTLSTTLHNTQHTKTLNTTHSMPQHSTQHTTTKDTARHNTQHKTQHATTRHSTQDTARHNKTLNTTSMNHMSLLIFLSVRLKLKSFHRTCSISLSSSSYFGSPLVFVENTFWIYIYGS